VGKGWLAAGEVGERPHAATSTAVVNPPRCDETLYLSTETTRGARAGYTLTGRWNQARTYPLVQSNGELRRAAPPQLAPSGLDPWSSPGARDGLPAQCDQDRNGLPQLDSLLKRHTGSAGATDGRAAIDWPKPARLDRGLAHPLNGAARRMRLP
jgi:hypothetical protein